MKNSNPNKTSKCAQKQIKQNNAPDAFNVHIFGNHTINFYVLYSSK